MCTDPHCHAHRRRGLSAIKSRPVLWSRLCLISLITKSSVVQCASLYLDFNVEEGLLMYCSIVSIKYLSSSLLLNVACNYCRSCTFFIDLWLSIGIKIGWLASFWLLIVLCWHLYSTTSCNMIDKSGLNLFLFMLYLDLLSQYIVL